MKRNPFFLILSLVTVGTAWAQQTGPNLPPHAPPQAPVGEGSASITSAEWQELRIARGAALQANPDLLAENRKLIERMRALEDKLDAVMVKTDPTLAPIIAKFEANRPHPGASAPPVTSATTPAK